jgi:hypothetical protein
MSKFKLPVIPSSTQKAIRFPNSTIERVEKAITGTKYSFSAFVVAATNHALDDLNITEKDSPEELKK